MHIKKAFLGKAGTAVVANERPIVDVYLHMALQMKKQCKVSTTDVTAKRFLSGMGVHMLLKSLPVWKDLPAYLADTRSLRMSM